MGFRIIRESVSVDGRAAKVIYVVTEELFMDKEQLRPWKNRKRPRAIAELRMRTKKQCQRERELTADKLLSEER